MPRIYFSDGRLKTKNIHVISFLNSFYKIHNMSKEEKYKSELKALNKELRKVRAEYKEAEEEAEYADWMLQGAERKMDVAKERIKGLNLKKRLLKK